MPGEFRTHGEIRAFFLCRRARKIWKRTNDDTETQMRRLFSYIERDKIPLQVVKKAYGMPSHTPLIQVVKFVHAVLAAVEMFVQVVLKKATMAFHTVAAVVLMPSQTTGLCSKNSVNATSVTKSEISRFRSRRPLPPDPYCSAPTQPPPLAAAWPWQVIGKNAKLNRRRDTFVSEISEFRHRRRD